MLSTGDLEHTLFGNITTFRDLFINNSSDRNSRYAMDQDDSSLYDEYEFTELFKFDNSSVHHDLSDYNMVMEKLKHMTYLDHNRSVYRREMFTDDDDRAKGEYLEYYKKDILNKINIQFTMHVRYEVGKALTQRDAVRNDRRYKIGYLFNRLRQLHVEQMKMVAAAIVQNNSVNNFALSSMIRIYERVVHLDVDMRDTSRLIKELFDAKEPYDFYNRTLKKKSKGPPKS